MVAPRGSARPIAGTLWKRPLPSRRLAVVLSALVDAHTVSEVADALWNQREAVDAVAAGLALSDSVGQRMHFVPGAGHRVSPAVRWHPLSRTDDLPIAEAARTGSPLFISSPATLLRRYPALRQAQETTGDLSWAVLPLSEAFGSGGVITFAWTERHRFGPAERALLGSLADAYALAVGRAVLQERHERALRQWDASLGPTILPELPGVDVAVRHPPTSAAVNGHFFDVFRADNDVWRLVVGAVSGGGVDAARAAGMARHSLRALPADLGPQAALARLNELANSFAGPGRFLTAVCADLTRRGDGATITVARAGHPPPILLLADGEIRVLSPRGGPLHTDMPLDLVEEGVDLHPDDMLLLHDDGDTGTLGWLDERRLSEIFDDCRGLSPGAFLDQLSGSLDDRRTGRPSDDLTLLALQVGRDPHRVGGR